MRKNAIGVVLAAALVFTVALTDRAEAEDGKYRLGLQSALFASGLSGIMEVSNSWAMQGILDFGVDAAAFRLLNRFKQAEYWNAYGNGSIGLWGHDHYHSRGWWGKDDGPYDYETRLGLGIGLGVEWDWRGIDTSLPPLGWNIEIGASVVPDFDLGLGLGVHWMF